MRLPISVTSVRRRWLDSLAGAGLLDRHARVDWQRVERLVFICKGNVCRSVYAERKSVGIGLTAISAGLDARGGHPANDAARRVAAARGVDLEEHVTQRFSDLDLGGGDLVVVMEPWHAQRAGERDRTGDWQLTLAGLWLTRRRAVIPDPYGEDDAVFERTFLMLDELVDRISRQLTAASAGGARSQDGQNQTPRR